MTPEDLRKRLDSLRRKRVGSETRAAARKRRRRQLTAAERKTVLESTGRKCHVCGGAIKEGEPWQADHVLAYSGGGEHATNNYLPAHFLCNNYRWDYLAEEFQWILKLGVWIRTQIERGTLVGNLAGKAFAAHEERREARRRPRPAK